MPLMIITVYSIPFYFVLGGTSSIISMIIYSIGYVLVYCLIVNKLMHDSYCVNMVRELVKKLRTYFYAF